MCVLLRGLAVYHYSVLVLDLRYLVERYIYMCVNCARQAPCNLPLVGGYDEKRQFAPQTQEESFSYDSEVTITNYEL